MTEGVPSAAPNAHSPSLLRHQNQAFGFRVSWATNRPVVIETSMALANPVWSPVRTNTLAGGWFYFADAEWRNYPARLYRVRSL